MCDEAVDDCLAALKFIPDWFGTSKVLEKFHNAFLANDDILFLMKILIKSYLLLIKDIFLLLILIKLVLVKKVILMKMMLIQLFMSDFWLGIVNLKNTKHFEKR